MSHMFISKCKTNGLPCAREISRLLILCNVDMRNESRVEITEFENLINIVILEKMGVY